MKARSEHGTWRRLGAGALGVLLVACDNGGPDFAVPWSEALVPTAPIDLWATRPGGPASGAGIWAGALIRDGVVEYANCLVVETGDLACLLNHPDEDVTDVSWRDAIAMRGTIANHVSGSGTLYSGPGRLLSDGNSWADFTITTGELSDENRTLELGVSVLDDQMTLRLFFQPFYYRDSSLASPELSAGTPADELPVVASGVYTLYPRFAPYDDLTSLSIDPDGALFLQSAAGCVANGQVTVIDPAVNGFDVDLTMSNCSDLDGPYAGVAYYPYEDSLFVIALFTDMTALAYGASK